jgi:hypothetical protein
MMKPAPLISFSNQNGIRGAAMGAFTAASKQSEHSYNLIFEKRCQRFSNIN